MSRPSRRSFIKGLAGAGVAGAVAGTAAAAAAADDSNASVPFHGDHQAGIVTPAQRHAAFAVFDVVAENKKELTELLRTLTERARFLTTGGTPTDPGITAPPNDSGVLGRTVPADSLTVTAGFGSSLFDDRYGLAGREPAHLRPMRTFPNDDLDPAWCHGDLSLQLCADNVDTVLHALRDIARHTRGAMQIRYRMDGFQNPPRPSGCPRNLMGFKDGTSNVDLNDAAQQRRLVWSAGGEPDWAVGGSYQVIRLIRMRVEFWDRVSLSEQENMFGRRRDTGAPLDGIHEYDKPQYQRDPTGEVIPLTSHMRLANPRTPQTADSFFLRRPYNYDLGTDDVGDLDMGLIFVAYQQDVKRQFEKVQERLIDEPLVDYITPFGGGYFFAPPGVRDSSDYLGRALLT
ncbi:MAG TPA: iron uptake transporter deferrochelatase/peroxidase subunit [Mycobacteriales bacterium]|nr:iron uptake transporter deferrochelatase/peroxidase subunit [Mycobacteriales bacterium]